MTQKKVRWAVVGTGRIARRTVGAAQRIAEPVSSSKKCMRPASIANS